MSAKDEHGLNPRQKKFADFFLSGLAAGVAYVRAGFSQNGAAVSASKLLTNAKVVAYIKEARRELSELGRWEKYRLLDFYQAVLETAVGDLDETSLLVQEVIRDEIGEQCIRTKIKMVAKMDAAKEMAKLMGWHAPEKLEVTADDELAELIRITRAGK